MEGTKPYTNNLDGNCCLSSGPRGIALIATFAFGTDADGAVVNLSMPERPGSPSVTGLRLCSQRKQNTPPPGILK